MRWLLELSILAVAAFALFRRPRVARAPFDAPLAIVAAALVGQSLLAWLAPAGGAAAGGAVHGARALLLLAAFAAWVSIVRASEGPRGRFWFLVASASLMTFGPVALRVVGWVVLLVVVVRLDWPKELAGWRRALGLVLSLPIAALTTLDPTGVAGLDTLQIGLQLEGVVKAQDPGHPIVQFLRVALALFRVQLVVAFFRFLLLPVGLRTLPLARRFAVNHTLTRSIPAFFSTLTVTAVIVLGYGLHKATDARQAMERTLDRASAAATLLLEDRPFDEAAAKARLALGEDAVGAALIRRGPEVAASDPESFVAPPSFPGDPASEAEGLLVVEGRFHLVARRGAAEAWIPLDETWLARYGERALVEVELREMPSVKLGSVVVSFRDAEATQPAAKVRTPGYAPETPGRTDLARRKFPLSRLFLPIGNWRETDDEGRRGAVGMTVRGSLKQALTAIRRNPYLLVSNAVPFLLLGGLGLVLGIVEGLAVRTGRSIVQTVVDDVRALERGADRIGGGDLDYRVPVPGKDELSRLAGALNAMAANLKRQRGELVEKERLEADLEAARSIQQRLLPQGSPTVAGLDVAGVSFPSRVVGGDLFYFLPFGEGSLGLAVGDVSGKSLPAAFLMSNVVAVLRAEAQIGVEVDESLSRINRLIAEQIEPNRFVTLFYGIVDRPSDTVRYACAGHEPPLIVRTDGTVAWLREGGTPLGVLPDRTYRTASEPFSKGDVLVLYSDGLTEAEGTDGEFFGNTRLAACVAAARGGTATEILEAILASVNAHTGGAPLVDDRTVVVVRGT
ncbi:MAG TPA: SpoIIE family protein phosphatase [Candidatus Polarisedimenticolaceae bacterium]